MLASALADLVGGQLEGPDVAFRSVAPLHSATADDLVFCQKDIPSDCAAGVLLASAAHPGHTVVVVSDPKAAFCLALAHLFPETHAGVHPGASVDESAQLGEAVVVYPGAVVGADCQVGDRTVIFANAVLYPGTVIGSDVRIHAGAVLGADGFSYHPGPDGPIKVPQVGRVRIEDGVEIGANTCVDRAFLGETVVGPNTKLDNLVHIGHNDQIGAAVLVAAQTGISGSVTVGDGVVMGGQVGVVDHVEIGAGAVLGGKTGVGHNLEGGQAYLGAPSMPAALWRRVVVLLRRLPEIWRSIGRLQRRVEALEESQRDELGS